MLTSSLFQNGRDLVVDSFFVSKHADLLVEKDEKDIATNLCEK